MEEVVATGQTVKAQQHLAMEHQVATPIITGATILQMEGMGFYSASEEVELLVAMMGMLEDPEVGLPHLAKHHLKAQSLEFTHTQFK